MFRNALRQSSRAVGAISATGRVVAVSLPDDGHTGLNSIAGALLLLPPASEERPQSPIGLFWGGCGHRGSFLSSVELLGVAGGARGRTPQHFEFRLTFVFSRTGEKSRTSSLQCRINTVSILRGRREGLSDRGVFHPRAADPRRPGGGWPRRDRPRPLGRVRLFPRGRCWDCLEQEGVHWGIVADQDLAVMVSPVCTAWPTSRPRSLSST